MKRREEEIGKLIEIVSKKSNGFIKPKIILIGGYALRAFIPFSRYTRDCDFALKKKNGWNLDEIKDWFPREVKIKAIEKRHEYGFLRFIKILRMNDKTAKASIDFMEGRVVGRTEEQTVVIDDNFVENSLATEIKVGDRTIKVFVPAYEDYLILKIVSSRPSDIRDIATLIWKNDVPDGLKRRTREILSYPRVFEKNIKETIIPIISDERFLDSWKGTFVTKEFTKKIKKEVLDRILRLNL